MNRKKPNSFLAAWLALLATTANAQSTASTPASATEPPKEMEAIVLSPFTVDASKDHGYIANRDVTGSRLNTALRDVPAAMTIFTQEMLRDLGVINAQQALEYAPNTEFTENTVGFNNLSLIKMRIRGFANAGAGPTQDFFQVFDDLDTYKIDRIGFSRGPNGVLFGVGDPGGKLTGNPKQANFAGNNYEVATRFDTWGSWRATVEGNYVLIPDRLALRAVALQQDQRTGVRGKFLKDKRLFLAGTWKLLERRGFHTSLRGNYEWINGEDALDNQMLLTDQVSNWINGGRVLGSLATLPTGTGNQSTANKLVYIAGASPAVPVLNWANTLRARGPIAGGIGTNIFDERLYPYDINPKGNGTLAPKKIENGVLFLEQQIGEDLFLEAALHRAKDDRRWALKTGGWQLNADPNALLPNGAVNPNAGKFYLEHDGRMDNRFTWRDTERLSGAYKLNFDRVNPTLGKWLGWHQVFAAWEEATHTSANEQFMVVNSTPLPGYPTQLNNAQNTVWVRSYLDYANGVYSFQPDVENLAPNNGVTPKTMPTVNQNRSRSITTSNIYALQSHFWEDRIVGTIGWRTDNVDTYNGLGAALRNPVTGLLPLARTQQLFFTNTAEFKPTSKGIIVRPLKWLGLQYNEAENFSSAPPSQRTLFGEPLAARGGTGKDYGVRVDLFNDKLTATFNIYEQAGINAILNQVIADDVNRIWTALGQTSRLTAGDPNVRDTQSEQSKGWEFTAFYNPTRNWRIYFGLTKNRTVVSNVYPNWLAYSALHLPTWQQNAALPVSGSTLATVGETITRIQNTVATPLLNEGNTAFNMRQWNATLTTNYRFTEGFLKNASVGGAVLYRGDAISGYPSVGGIPQRNQPFEERGYYTVNVNLGYDYRFADKKNLRLQLTIGNAFDLDGRVIVTERTATTSSDGTPPGTPIRARWLPGASVAFSASLGF